MGIGLKTPQFIHQRLRIGLKLCKCLSKIKNWIEISANVYPWLRLGLKTKHMFFWDQELELIFEHVYLKQKLDWKPFTRLGIRLRTLHVFIWG